MSDIQVAPITEELPERPLRDRNPVGESRALALLSEEMVANPRGVLQKLAELVVELLGVSSAGVSILEPGDGEKRIFRWHAVAGPFAANLGGTMPQDASPCGIVLSRNRVLLFKRPERFFPALRGVEPRIYESLLAPWNVSGKAIGTVWAISHEPDHHFDAEDARLLRNLSRFASAGWQLVSALDEAEAGRRELERRVEDRTSALIASNQALRDRDELLATLDLGSLMARGLDGTIRFWSQGCTRLYGWTAAEAVGRSAPHLLHTIYPVPLPEIETALERNGEWTGDLHQRARDARELIVTAHKILRRDTGGHPAVVLEFLVDVTAQRRAEAALQASQRRLQELQAELLHVSRLSVMGQMAAALAHELNQPLTAATNYFQACQRLLEHPNLATIARVRQALDLASEQLLRSGRIINRLRAFVTRSAVEKRPENVAELIEEAGALASPALQDIGVSIESQVSPDARWVLVDRVPVQQVLLNLIRNGAEAMEGTETGKLTIAAERTGEMVRFSVVDTGSGLPPEVAAQLFQPFVTTKENGMGIGLSICRTIIEAHGGRIWAEPNAAGGTVFRFTLPAASEPETIDPSRGAA
ncbi:MAG: PAS domain S-box protein [Acetobacteraceae bacterium]|nr:PAS domain S-box protein [Acetobacteraceae bacterium]